MGARAYAAEGLDARRIAAAVAGGALRPRFPPGAPAAYRDLAEACWAADPAARPGLGEVCARLEALAAGYEAAAQA